MRYFWGIDSTSLPETTSILVFLSNASVPPLSRCASRKARPHAMTRSTSPSFSNFAISVLKSAVTAKRAAQRAAEQRPAVGIDPYPIAVQCHVDGARLSRVCIPCDVAQQAGCQPQPSQLPAFVREERVHPNIDGGPVIAKPAHRSQPPMPRRAMDLRPWSQVKVAIEQPFAKPERRYIGLPRPKHVDHRFK